MSAPQNDLVRSAAQLDLYQPPTEDQPKSPESPIEEDVVITTTTYDIPLATLRQEEQKRKFYEKMKKCCDCAIL